MLKAVGAFEEVLGMGGWPKAREQNVGPLGCLLIKPPQYLLWLLMILVKGPFKSRQGVSLRLPLKSSA